MNTGLHQGSAKIYQFPLRGRLALGARLEETKSATEINAPRTVCGSGWYHEAAIQDSERTGEH
jgi:hypothetical protein